MRLIARFAKEQQSCFEIITVYDTRVAKERINKRTPALVSIAKEYPTAVWFERKISDDFGIEILYSHDKRPLVKHEHFPKNTYPMRKDFSNLSLEYTTPSPYKSDENRGVILGPVQPYHLESSQFQLFDREGDILHFESIPFYKYRAIEKMVEGMSLEEAKPIVERIAGTSSIAYQLAYLEIQLQASKRILPSSLKVKHMFFLEFERVINHLSDLGIMCKFINFKEGFSFFMKLVEYGRETMGDLTGHRFGFDAINMQSSSLELEKGYKFIRHLEKELLWFEEWIKDKRSFWKLLIQEGLLSKEDAVELGLVGIVARSVNIDLDRRAKDKLYTDYGFVTAQERIGDSSSRFKIRITEIHTSLRVMRRVLDNRVLPFFLGSFLDGEYYAYIESWAGELMMYIELKDEKIERFFVRDPSFFNAQALSRSLKGNEINAMGLIIKSMPISFSAIDL
jgi:Ni,Fe-hydrogenase III large subunit